MLRTLRLVGHPARYERRIPQEKATPAQQENILPEVSARADSRRVDWSIILLLDEGIMLSSHLNKTNKQLV